MDFACSGAFGIPMNVINPGRKASGAEATIIENLFIGERKLISIFINPNQFIDYNLLNYRCYYMACLLLIKEPYDNQMPMHAGSL
jgi:hypothetical protein